MKQKKAVCFGEVMLRLNPPGYERFLQTSSLVLNTGGAEANVAVSLSCLGMDAAMVTALPPHEMGQVVVNSLRRWGVDCSDIVRTGERVGIYFLEKGASQRGSLVIYDRAHSSIADADPSLFDWERILTGAEWFHFTGITPAISETAARCCHEACETAKRMGITISCDLNYRSKLWTPARASEVMRPLIAMTDLCIANEEHAGLILGIKAENSMGADGDGISDRESYKTVAERISSEYGCRKVAITLRSTISASDNRCAGMLYDAASGQSCFSPVYDLHIVDRIGGGDAFDAGLIYSLANGRSDEDALAFATAAEAIKHSVEGDFNICSAAEVNAVMRGHGSGRVSR